MNRILVLEDNEERNKKFREIFRNDVITCVDDVKDLIFLLQKSQWDFLFLDHDLGGEVYVSTNNKNCGSEAARWLAENEKYQPQFIIIHSLNNQGQIHIKSLLPKSLSLPFAWTKLSSSDLDDPNFLKFFSRRAEQQAIQLSRYGRIC